MWSPLAVSLAGAGMAEMASPVLDTSSGAAEVAGGPLSSGDRSLFSGPARASLYFLYSLDPKKEKAEATRPVKARAQKSQNITFTVFSWPKPVTGPA